MPGPPVDPTSPAAMPITEPDARLEQALRDAHLPTLMAALVHLSDDTELLERAGPLHFDFFGGEQGGLSEEFQAEVRSSALAILAHHRDAGSKAPAPISPETVRRLMNFLAGQEIPDSYVPFLLEELALDGSDTRAQTVFDGVSAEQRAEFPVVIIGAGVSGIAAAVRLEQSGIPFTIIEKNPDVGGTWLENTYPGCRVDTPNHLYSFSFERNSEWPQHYSTQPVLLDYLRGVVDRRGLREHLCLGTRVEHAEWDEARSTWRVHVRGAEGERSIEARAVICSVGQLNQPRYPEIPGRERFAGPWFHSARWNHEVELRGKRVAVIGTGASAFQFVPEIADRTADLVVFQRSAPWLGPTRNYHEDVPEGMQWLLRHVPYYEKWYRFWLFWMMTDGLLPAVTGDPAWRGNPLAVSEWNDGIRKMLTSYIEMQIPDDAELRKAAVPNYPPGGKRMLRDNGVWLRTLQRDDVTLTTDPIRSIDATGVTTADGTHYDVDVIIYGTGFRASDFLSTLRVTGTEGQSLHDRWAGDARAYLGACVPGFPNFFMMYGPNTNIVVNGSIMFFAECEARYILGCIDLLLRGPHASMQIRPAVHDEFNRRVDRRNLEMAWGWPGVDSWYKNAKGRVSQNWPFTLGEFWTATLRPDPSDYEFE